VSIFLLSSWLSSADAPFGAVTQLVGRQEGHLACKKVGCWLQHYITSLREYTADILARVRVTCSLGQSTLYSNFNSANYLSHYPRPDICILQRSFTANIAPPRTLTHKLSLSHRTSVVHLKLTYIDSHGRHFAKADDCDSGIERLPPSKMNAFAA